MKIALGCWPLGGDHWGTQNDADSVDVIRAALELGITHFDTAQGYGKGHGEELLGSVILPVRDTVVIATKMHYMQKERVAAAVIGSLQRLNSDYIDILYIHWPKKKGDLAAMMDALEKARTAGMIRRIGVSNFSVANMQEVMKAGKIDVCQVCWNLLWRREERELIPFCHANNIRLVTYSSLAEGILTGKFPARIDFAPGDHRKYTVLFDEKLWPRIHAAVDEMKLVAADAHRPLGHCAIRWLTAKKDVDTVLVGARNAAQVAENAAAETGEIDESVFSRLTEISDRLLPDIPDAGNIFKWYP